jgi:hypothetical protein
MDTQMPDSTNVDQTTLCNILSLDGGGAKGVYTLGVLHEIEAIAPRPLHQCFDLIYGTSTGSIIAALLACGETVESIRNLYFDLVPKVMGNSSAKGRSKALIDGGKEIFANRDFDSLNTNLGIVALRCDYYRPMIFKNSNLLAQGRRATFLPGFGAPLYQAVIASCSAYPFFQKYFVETKEEGNVPVIDGGFVANDPTLFAITDAVRALGNMPESTRVISIGTGDFPAPEAGFWERLGKRAVSSIFDIELTETIMRSNANALDLVRGFLLAETPCIRINERFNRSTQQTTFLEKDVTKLTSIYSLGRNSFGSDDIETRIRSTFDW